MFIKFRSVSVLFGEHVPVVIFLQYADFYVVDTQREKGMSFRIDEPPAIVDFLQTEKPCPLMFDLLPSAILIQLLARHRRMSPFLIRTFLSLGFFASQPVWHSHYLRPRLPGSPRSIDWQVGAIDHSGFNAGQICHSIGHIFSGCQLSFRDLSQHEF